MRSRGGTVTLWDSTTMAPANPPIVEPPPSSNRPQLHAPNREPHPTVAEARLGCIVVGISGGCGSLLSSASQVEWCGAVAGEYFTKAKMAALETELQVRAHPPHSPG